MNLKYQKFIIFSVLLLAIIAFFDKTLAIGFIFISFLSVLTFLAINKNKEQAKILGLLFLIAFLIHIAAVLFIYYAHFQPFSGGGGDYNFYQQQAQEIAGRVQQGNFSLQEIGAGHYYPVIVGYIYAFTIPEMLIGQIFNAWLVALSVVFVYLIVQEIGGSEKQGFIAGLIVSIYPSLLFYGSLLLKDALVVLLCLIGLLLMLKLIQRFSWSKFLIFYIVLGCSIHVRFYVGFAFLLCFILCWLLFSNLKLKKRLVYALLIIFVLGFLPGITASQGYYGRKFLKSYLNPGTITYYREVVYAPPEEKAQAQKPQVLEEQVLEEQVLEEQVSEEVEQPLKATGQDSSVIVKTGFENPFTFLKNSAISFSYSLFGPFPWQMTRLKHLFVLPEMIAWYFLFFFAIKGAISSIRRYRVILPLVIFSLTLLCVLAFFINNFGIITRIRIPAFISLLCLTPFGFNYVRNNRNL